MQKVLNVLYLRYPSKGGFPAQEQRSKVIKEKWGRCSKCFGTGTQNRTSKLLSKSSNADTGGIVATETQECNAIQQYGKRSLIAME